MLVCWFGWWHSDVRFGHWTQQTLCMPLNFEPRMRDRVYICLSLPVFVCVFFSFFVFTFLPQQILNMASKQIRKPSGKIFSFQLGFSVTVYTLLLHVCFCVPVFYLFYAALARHSSACCFSRKNVVVFGRYVFLWINVLCRPRNSDRKWTSHSAWRSNICNNTLSWCYECGNKNACVRMGIVHNTVDFVLRNSSAVAPFYLFCLILSQPQYPSHVSDCTEFKMNKQGIVIFHNSERFFSYWLMVSTETWNGFCLLIGLNGYGTNCNERRSSILVAAAITAKNSVWKLWNIRTENFYSCKNRIKRSRVELVMRIKFIPI